MIKEKTRARTSGSTIAIITLSVLLLAAIGVGVALAFFTANANVAGNITLGNPVTIGITQGGASATSLTFSVNSSSSLIVMSFFQASLDLYLSTIVVISVSEVSGKYSKMISAVLLESLL